jgi:hypothetical protein
VITPPAGPAAAIHFATRVDYRVADDIGGAESHVEEVIHRCADSPRVSEC